MTFHSVYDGILFIQLKRTENKSASSLHLQSHDQDWSPETQICCVFTITVMMCILNENEIRITNRISFLVQYLLAIWTNKSSRNCASVSDCRTTELCHCNYIIGWGCLTWSRWAVIVFSCYRPFISRSEHLWLFSVPSTRWRFRLTFTVGFNYFT